MTADGQRVQRDDAPGERDRFVDPPEDLGEPARGMQARRVARRQLDRRPERRIGALPVEVARREDLPQRDVPFDEVRRQRQRPMRRPRVPAHSLPPAATQPLATDWRCALERPAHASAKSGLQRDGLPEELDGAGVVRPA